MKNLQVMILSMTLTALLFAGCQSGSKGDFKVTVSYRNLDKMAVPGTENGAPEAGTKNGKTKVLLEEIPSGGDLSPVIIDSAALNEKNGEVVLQGNGKQESIYQLIVEDGPFMLLINDNSNINVDVDLARKENYYTVTGSEASNMLKNFIADYSTKTTQVNRSFEALDSLKRLSASDSMMIVYTGRKNKAMDGMNGYLRQIITDSKHPALSLFALGWASRSLPQQDFELALNEVLKKFPDHEVLKKLKTSYDMQKAQQADQRRKQETASLVGRMAPELNLPDSTGKIVSLASYRGKYLLIDFWASWCGPCRQENPNVVEAFNRFRDRNFAVLGVSIDRERESWLKAINDDGLAWTHVSDLKYWESKAVQIYHFEGIPYNVLVDPQGKIIAESLRGPDLENKLQTLLKVSSENK